jgi:hypothetical protein
VSDQQNQEDAEKDAAVWRSRFIHVAGKLGVVLGLNNQERSWVREAGFDCPDEERSK